MSRTGKIARIPNKIRTALNERLDNGEEAKSILAWLNDMPQADDVLRDHFKGALITEQNLSEWRQGGFREWAFRRHHGRARQVRGLPLAPMPAHRARRALRP